MLELSRDGVVMAIDPADGGRIVSLVIGGVERILPKARARTPTSATSYGCFPMVPWAGRLAQGRIPTAGGEVRLELNRPPSAIHGLGFEVPWSIVERSATAIAIRCELRGRGWPFGGRAVQRMRLGAGGLELELDVGEYERTGPAGLGWHPWFTRPPQGDLAVQVDASEVLSLDADLVPTGAVRPVTPSEDLRSGPNLGDRRLDHVYVRAKGPAFVRWPDLELRIEFDRSLSTVVVHTPPQGICVEPQTLWPNAPLLAAAGIRDTGLRTLEPGESLRAKCAWSWKR